MNLRFPAEWEPQRSVWLTWPGNPATWKGLRKEVKRDHALLAAVCTRFQPVELICCYAWRKECIRFLTEAAADLSRITFHDWPVNDAWTRDHGPLFLQGAEGPEIVDLPYNAWGGKFPPWEEDDSIPERISELRKLPRKRFPMFGEGGGLESNGQGVLLVTESVWLNPNRNPHRTRQELEAAFREFLGVEETFWLAAGMASDDTDGHIDTLVRFVDAGTVLLPVPGPDHPDAEQLVQNRELCRKRFSVVDLPHPDLPGLPATYANAVWLNGGILVPVYGVPADDVALEVYRSCFPDREIVAVPSRTFVEEGGAVHCLTANEWA